MSAELVAVLGIGLAVLACCAVLLRWVRATSRRVHVLERASRQAARAQAKQLERLTSSSKSLAAALKEQRQLLDALRTQNSGVRAAVLHDTESVKAHVQHVVDRAVREVRADGLDDAAQIEAMLQLVRLADLREAIPRTRGYPVSPDALLVLVDLIRSRRPSVYLDLGSGTSTIVAASTARAIDLDLRVIAIDHEDQYAHATCALAARHGLEDAVEVRVAPLVPLPADPTSRWYDLTVLEDLRAIDMCFVDGPPGATNPHARHPAKEFLEGRLSERAVVVLDDTARSDEADLAATWGAQPGVTAIPFTSVEKGLTVLEFGARPPG